MTRLHPSASFLDGLGFHSNRKDFLLLVPVGVLSAVTLAREMNCSGEEQQMTMAHSFQFEFLVPYYKFKKLKTEQDFVALKHCRDPKEEYEPHRLETDLSNTSLMSYHRICSMHWLKLRLYVVRDLFGRPMGQGNVFNMLAVNNIDDLRHPVSKSIRRCFHPI